MTSLDPRHGVLFDAEPLVAGLTRRLRGRVAGTGSCTHARIVELAAAAGGSGGPRFVLRVDDFPRWDRDPAGFLRFHEILAAEDIPYVLGVIPAPCGDPESADGGEERRWTDEEIRTLRAVSNGVELALHGWSHRRRPGPVADEIVGGGPEELRRHLAAGLDRLEQAGLRAGSFIPPYNAVDRPSIEAIGERLPVVFGGPESVRWLGCVPGPTRLGASWYLPSYAPAYGRAAEVAALVERIRDRDVPLLVPVTLHWSWEEDDGLGALPRLAAALSGAAVRLDTWLRGEAWGERAAAAGGGEVR